MDKDTNQEPPRESTPEHSPAQAFLDTHRRMAGTLRDVFTLTPEEAKEFVDEMISRDRHLRKPCHKDLPYGIPTTLEEFIAYESKSEQYPAIFSRKIGTDPEAYAEQVVRNLRNRRMPVMMELHKRGINSDHYWQSVTDPLIKPAEFDINKLDPRLTDEEKKFVRFRVAVAQYLVEKGLLVSTEMDAPKDSSWAQRVRQSLAEETTAVLAHLR